MLVYDNWTVEDYVARKHKSVVVSVSCARVYVCVCVCVFYKGYKKFYKVQHSYHKATLYEGVTWHTSDV